MGKKRTEKKPELLMTRRQVVKTAVLSGSGILLAKAVPVAGRENNLSLGKAFEPDIEEILAAAAEVILPGAIDAGIPAFMDYWLTQKPFDNTRKYLMVGAIQLNNVAKRKYKRKFTTLKHGEQEVILRMFQGKKIRIKKFDGYLFYKQLVEFVIEGYLSDPKYGGNRDRVGWKFIGIPDGMKSRWWNPVGVGRLLNPDKGFHD
ncbi:MAG: gluconate 2-dehydrogenase subunit 3 family protein [Deltaproteobacteria bacterium]|nr:gluconate 2-dehydrogenase subunit 3 family protein [Deltaproteobacteria bacterium]